MHDCVLMLMTGNQNSEFGHDTVDATQSSAVLFEFLPVPVVGSGVGCGVVVETFSIDYETNRYMCLSPPVRRDVSLSEDIGVNCHCCR